MDACIREIAEVRFGPRAELDRVHRAHVAVGVAEDAAGGAGPGGEVDDHAGAVADVVGERFGFEADPGERRASRWRARRLLRWRR